MSEKEYIVTLNKDVDYEAFDAEMVAITGAGAIPNRSPTVANARPASKRNTHYMLTDEEAQTLATDARVMAVEIPPDQRDDLEIGLLAVQDGTFTKTTSDTTDFLNWGMRRCNEAVNPYGAGTTAPGGYNYTLDGTGVDVVIQDSGIQADHPEFQDANGVSRVQEIDWYDGYSGGGSMPTAHYSDYHGHGTHVAGTAAGKKYGWAKNARIYAVKVNGLQGSADPNSGIPVADCFDVIKEWHQNKPVDPTTGVKRPTVVNMSWGYGSYFYDVASITYRGTTTVSPDTSGIYRDTAKGMIGSFYSVTFGYRFGTHVASVDADVDEMIDAGIHVCIAAGNYRQRIDVPGGIDHDNYWTSSSNGSDYYYHRGSSPFSDRAFIVGNIDSTINADSLEQKASSSECGPGVNIWAPGTDIISSCSNTSEIGTTGVYPDDNSFKIANIGGTSMASPQVAGVAALYAQLEPASTPAELKAWVTDQTRSAQIHTTNLGNDYTDDRSISESTGGFLYNPFNISYKLRITDA